MRFIAMPAYAWLRPGFAGGYAKASGLRHALATLQRGDGGRGGIRTLDTNINPYNGLANRRLQPLGHSSILLNCLMRRRSKTAIVE